jgi:hypothetical protein
MSYRFADSLRPGSGRNWLGFAVFQCKKHNGLCHPGLLTACEQDQEGGNWFGSAPAEPDQFHPDPARKLSANLYDIHHCSVYSEKIPDDGQRNFPKHVEFYFKHKFEKVVHLVGFIIRNVCRRSLKQYLYVCTDCPYNSNIKDSLIKEQPGTLTLLELILGNQIFFNDSVSQTSPLLRRFFVYRKHSLADFITNIERK